MPACRSHRRFASVTRPAPAIVSAALVLSACGGGTSGTGTGPVAADKATVRIEVSGYGNARDGDGFIGVAGAAQQAVAWNGATTITGLPPGSISVSLAGVASHCVPDASAFTRSVAAGQVDTVRFTVGCFGDLAFMEQVTGGDWHIVYMDTLGVLTRLTSAAGRQNIQAWSPDGTRLAFETNERNDRNPNNQGGWDLASITLAGRTTTWLATSPEGDKRARWSPDGTALAYQRWRVTDTAGTNVGLQSSTIHIVAADGTGDRVPLDSLRYDFDPDWILAGSKIAFGCRRLVNPAAVCAVTPIAGPGLVTAIDGPRPNPQSMVAAPDGTWLGYVDQAPGQGVWVVPSAGGTSTNLAPTVTTFDRSWSPDGTQLTVNTVEATGVYGVRTVRRDGTSLSPNLTAFSTNVGIAPWSPDGRWLAFSATDSSGGQHLYVMRPDGSGRRQLTFESPQVQFNPFWRPRSVFVAPPSARPVGGGAVSAAPSAGTAAGRQIGPRPGCAAFVGTTARQVPCGSREGVVLQLR